MGSAFEGKNLLQEFAPRETSFSLQELNPTKKRGKRERSRVASPENVPILINIIKKIQYSEMIPYFFGYKKGFFPV